MAIARELRYFYECRGLRCSSVQDGASGNTPTSVRQIVTGPLLFSTNTWLKRHVQQRYRKDKHFVWCSETFDATKDPSFAGNNPPSSDPYALFGRLYGDVKREDDHSTLIQRQRQSLLKLAKQWHTRNEISDTDRDEIVLLAKQSTFKSFRPLIYVIPRAPVEARLVTVPMKDRANKFGLEWTIGDLLGSEFDVVELGL